MTHNTSLTTKSWPHTAPFAVVAATDDGFGLPTATMAASLAAAADRGRVIDFYVLDGGLTGTNAERLQRALAKTATRARQKGVTFRPTLLSPDTGVVEGLTTHAHVSLSTYLRLLIPDLLPSSVGRAVYIDGDVVVRRDLGELFALDLGGAPAAAAPNVTKSTIGTNMKHHEERGLDPDAMYINAGVMVLDVDRWRDERLGATVLDDLHRHQHLYQFWDQCGLNAVLQNRWADLPPEWNVQVGSPVVQSSPPALSEIAAIHFTSKHKPWQAGYLSAFGPSERYASYRNEWFRSSAASGWYRSRTDWAVDRAAITAEETVRRLKTRVSPLLSRSKRAAKKGLSFAGRALVERGVPSSVFGYRHVERETVREHVARGGAGRYETVHPPSVAHNPLPENVADRAALPDDQGWWGYSFWDVPERTSGETFVVTVPDALVTWYRDEDQGGDFFPAVVTTDGRGLDLREVRFRPKHGRALRQSGPPVEVERATWIAERVYDNHSHWLTAHLPKLLLLKERGELADVLLPPERTAAIDGSLRMVGLDPDAFATFDMSRPLRVGELTLVGSDRFRPELLQSVRAALPAPPAERPRRLYVSRAKAARRRLLNEDELWPHLERAGFERVFLEDHPFEAQVRLMQEAAVVVAPHGAGLTNILFCAPGTHVVEIADWGFPNPNFYAIAAAMGLRYWFVQAESVGDVHPLEQDLAVPVESVTSLLPRLLP